MSNSPWSRSDRRRQLLAAWERRCRARGEADHCTGADALFLVTTLTNAIRHGSATPELGRAARTWGAGFAAPVEALATLTHLRDALTDEGDGSREAPAVPAAVVNRVFDQVMMEAVDAASTNLRSVARKDPLTGCANRRALDEELGHAVSSAWRSGLDLTVAIVDLDGLKVINDNYGHAAGDAALVSLVAVLRSVLREADTLYRTGGDEFVVVSPFTESAGARALMRRAERIGGPSFSWGIASLGQLPGDVAPEMVAPALLATADGDLYHRRRAHRQAILRDERKRRIVTVASLAASAAVVTSGVGLAAALTIGSSPSASPSTGTTLGAPENKGGSTPPLPAHVLNPQGSPSPSSAPAGTSLGVGSSPPKSSGPSNLALSRGSTLPAVSSLAANVPSVGPTLVSAVGPPITSALALSASATPVLVSQSVSFVADVVPGGAGGTVAFLDGGTAIPSCVAVPVSSGQAVCTVQYDSAGSHTISALFVPTATGMNGARSNTLSETVTNPPSSPGSPGSGDGGGGGTSPHTAPGGGNGNGGSGGGNGPGSQWGDGGGNQQGGGPCDSGQGGQGPRGDS